MTSFSTRLRHFSLVVLAAYASAQNIAPVALPPRSGWANSFPGICYGFHACTVEGDIGRQTTRVMVVNVTDQVHPDYIQIACKGHFGLSSYATTVGIPAPSFAGEPDGGPNVFPTSSPTPRSKFGNEPHDPILP